MGDPRGKPTATGIVSEDLGVALPGTVRRVLWPRHPSLDEVLRADECEFNMELRWNEGAGETGDPRENPPANDIVRHDSHLKIRARFTLVGSERVNRSATVALSRSQAVLPKLFILPRTAPYINHAVMCLRSTNEWLDQRGPSYPGERGAIVIVIVAKIEALAFALKTQRLRATYERPPSTFAADRSFRLSSPFRLVSQVIQLGSLAVNSRVPFLEVGCWSLENIWKFARMWTSRKLGIETATNTTFYNSATPEGEDDYHVGEGEEGGATKPLKSRPSGSRPSHMLSRVSHPPPPRTQGPSTPLWWLQRLLPPVFIQGSLEPF
ncbi:hypothetical protein PR048_014871 [Dryococelus australis]|uniref:Uncharacterized protein n=1 Tax=Dryococelus australis TaxID=614101 RepID=A0ABQ9HFE4_9NEOP|nr:hypothetical protein PR048_014871 [Dryococelus australis]